MFGQEPGYNRDRNFFWRFLTEIRINTHKLGFFYFGPYILHLLFHKNIGFVTNNSTKFASLSSSQKNTLVITTAAMLSRKYQTNIVQ